MGISAGQVTNEDVERKFQHLASSVHKMGMVVDSVQSDVMQLNRAMKEASLDCKPLTFSHKELLCNFCFVYEFLHSISVLVQQLELKAIIFLCLAGSIRQKIAVLESSLQQIVRIIDGSAFSPLSLFPFLLCNVRVNILPCYHSLRDKTISKHSLEAAQNTILIRQVF